MLIDAEGSHHRRPSRSTLNDVVRYVSRYTRASERKIARGASALLMQSTRRAGRTIDHPIAYFLGDRAAFSFFFWFRDSQSLLARDRVARSVSRYERRECGIAGKYLASLFLFALPQLLSYRRVSRSYSGLLPHASSQDFSSAISTTTATSRCPRNDDALYERLATST